MMMTMMIMPMKSYFAVHCSFFIAFRNQLSLLVFGAVHYDITRGVLSTATDGSGTPSYSYSSFYICPAATAI